MLTKGGGESRAPQDPSGYALVTPSSFCSTIRKIHLKKVVPEFPYRCFPPYHRADSQFISILAWLQLHISKLCGVGALFMWPHCNILGKMLKAEFWLFTDKIYVYLCSKWVLYHTAVKLGLVLVPIESTECGRGREKCAARIERFPWILVLRPKVFPSLLGFYGDY